MLENIDNKLGEKMIFIPKSNWTENIIKKNLVFENDIYKKYKSTLKNISGELIICSNLDKLEQMGKIIVEESYEEYLNFISKRNFSKEKWIYNILDGLAEQDKIIYQDNKILIIPNYTWINFNNIDKIHLLVIPKNRVLHTIRDLDKTHIELLKYIKNKTLQIIKSKYDFNYNIIKMYFHYPPSTYHIHIHFVLISNTDVNSSVEYSHELSNVISNLIINSDYYKLITMNKLISL